MPTATPSEPDTIALLPLAYVAWADGVLTPSEIATARESFAATYGEEVAEEAWDALLDPARPPSAETLEGWLRTIRELGAQLPSGQRRSLAELGAAMARISAKTEGSVSVSACEALAKVEAALGVIGPEVAAELVSGRHAKVVDEPSDRPLAEAERATLQALFEGEHEALRKEVRALLRDPTFAHDHSIDGATYRERTLSWCRELAARGLGGVMFPEEFAGRNDPAGFIAVFETLALHDLSLTVKYGVQFGLFGNALFQLGTLSHHTAWLAAAARLELPGCFAMTETGHGSNVRSIETTARYDAATASFVLDTPHEGARKDYIGNAACHGRMAVVFAQLEVGEAEHGVHAFVVPIRDAAGQPCPGVRIGDCGPKMGLPGVDNGRLSFDGVRVPRENLLDRFGAVAPDGTYTSPIASPGRRFFAMLQTLVGGRVGVACAAASAARVGLCIAVRYGARRRQFGPAGQPETVLLDYRTHQRRLMPLLAQSYALFFALRELVGRFTACFGPGAEPDEDARRQLEVLAAGFKAYATRATTDALQECREACGGQGYLAVNRFAALKADTDVFTTFEGDNTVLLQLVAKGLLSRYKQSFSDLKFFGLLRYLAGEAATALAELNPVSIRLSSEAHLRDAGFQLGLLRYREQSLLASVARRLKRRLDGGMDSFAAVVECQDHLVALASAHVEAEVLASFQRGCAALPEGGLRDKLSRLCSLHGLGAIEREAAWYLENELMVASKARAIRDQVNTLCAEVRRDAVALVDAWVIPSVSLGAPIALDEV